MLTELSISTGNKIPLNYSELSISTGNKIPLNYFNIKLEIHACSNPSPCHDKVLLSACWQTFHNVHRQLQATVNILVLLYFSIQWHTFISIIYNLLHIQNRAKCFKILTMYVSMGTMYDTNSTNISAQTTSCSNSML
jgi:hypothetical protein